MSLGPWHRGPSTGTAMMKVSSLVIAAVAKGSMLIKSFGAMPGHHRWLSCVATRSDSIRFLDFCLALLRWERIGVATNWLRPGRKEPSKTQEQKVNQETSFFFSIVILDSIDNISCLDCFSQLNSCFGRFSRFGHVFFPRQVSNRICKDFDDQLFSPPLSEVKLKALRQAEKMPSNCSVSFLGHRFVFMKGNEKG